MTPPIPVGVLFYTIILNVNAILLVEQQTDSGLTRSARSFDSLGRENSYQLLNKTLPNTSNNSAFCGVFMFVIVGDR